MAGDEGGESFAHPGFWVSIEAHCHNKNKFILSRAFRVVDAFVCRTLSESRNNSVG